MFRVILQPEDISLENICWEIKKLKHMKRSSSDLLRVEVAGKIFDLIICGEGKFVPWYMSK